MLKKHPRFAGIKGPVLTVVMDGIGINKSTVGNAIHHANTPTLDRLFKTSQHVVLKAHGTAVGMPSDDDMGNSEVGHNALGAGRVFNQGASLVSEAIASGELFEKPAWKDIVDNAKAHNSTVHFLGLFSDGNVHSHMDHLKAMIDPLFGRGGDGGNASVFAETTVEDGSAVSTATAYGGDGPGDNKGDSAGGDASANVRGAGNRDVTVQATARGGAGSDADDGLGGEKGGDATAIGTGTGGDSVVVEASAVGGLGGGGGNNGVGGDGGNALSRANASGRNQISARSIPVTRPTSRPV